MTARPPARTSLSRVLAGVVALALIAAAVVAVLWWRADDDPLADAPTDLAEQAAMAFFTLDHRTLDEDRARLFALTTSSFEETYEAQSEGLRDQVSEQRMVLTPSVPQGGTAVEGIDEESATVLVAVDVRTEAAQGAAGDERYRTRLHLLRSGEEWEVDRIEQVTPSGEEPSDDTTLPEAADAAVSAAAAALPLALGYDYRELDAGLDAAVATMTEDFGEEFRRTFADSAARLAEDKEAVTSATVSGAGLVRLEDDDRALCLLFVDQALVSSATLGDPENPVQVSQNRVLVEMRLVDDAWLVDSIQPF